MSEKSAEELLPEGTVHEATLTVDCSAIHATFSARTAAIMERAAFMLRALDAASENLGLLPVSESLAVPVKIMPRPIGEVRPESATWVVECAIRDSLEQVQWLLHEVRRVCAVVHLASAGEVSLKQVEQAEHGDAKKFDRLTLPDKLTELRTKYGPEILAASFDDILSLNAARNCLVHAHGLVRDRDCDATGRLVVRWYAFELKAVRDEGEVHARPDVVLEAGTKIVLRRTRIERAFAPGERVAFTAGDLSTLWVSLHFLGLDTARRANEYVQRFCT